MDRQLERPGGFSLLNRVTTVEIDWITPCLAAMSAVALAAVLWATRGINPVRGDSFEYLFFDYSRPVGYPAFLWSVRLLTGDVSRAVQAQMTLLAMSLLWLSWNLQRLVQRPAWSMTFHVALLLQVGMWKASAFVMTEGLSAALIALWCGQLLRMFKGFSLRQGGLLIAIAGCAVAVRPSLLGMLLGSGLFLVACGGEGQRLRLSIIAATGLLIAPSATPLAQWALHGSMRTTSPLARGLLQHSLFCEQPSITRDADAALVEDNASEVRRYIQTAPSDLQPLLRRAYSSPLRFGLIIPVLGQRHGLETRSQADPYLYRIARERLAANPTCFAGSVAASYWRLATFGTNRTTHDERRLRAFLAAHPALKIKQYPPLPGEQRLERLTAAALHQPPPPPPNTPVPFELDIEGKVSALKVLPARLVFGGAGLIGLAALALLARRKLTGQPVTNRLAASAAMAIAFHGTLAITAIVELGLSRYMLPLWPIACTLIWLTALAVRDSGERLLGRPEAGRGPLPAA